MLVGITGHTSGIGLGIHNYFKNRGHTVFGFSRSTGHNIQNTTDRQNIIKSCLNYDIFVNNAYSNFDNSQNLLLNEIYNLWKDNPDKLIINISSRWTKDKHPYCLTKLAGDKFCESKMYSKPRIINFKPGWIDTPRVIEYREEKMSVDNFIEVFDFIVGNWKKYNISSLTFGI